MKWRIAHHGRPDEARLWCERALLLTATQERTDPAVLGKLELVSRGLDSDPRLAAARGL